MGGEQQHWLALGCSLLRGLLIAVVALPIAHAVQRQWCRRGGIAWGLLLLPMLTPGLLIGYCYRDTAMAWIASPWRTEMLYDLLLLAQLVPVAVVLLQLSPRPAVSPAAAHCAELLRVHERSSRLKRLWWGRVWFHARGERDVIIAAIVFLLAFQEAEVASLLQARTWTEWIFTNQARGLPVLNTLEYASRAMLLQLPVIIPVAHWIARASRSGNLRSRSDIVTGSAASISWTGVGLWLLIAALLVTAIPTVQLIRGAGTGWSNLLDQPALGEELGDAALLATTVALLTTLLCRLLLRVSRLTSWGICVALLPGLLGALSLGITLAAIFQTDRLAFAYDTPVPLILGEVLFLLPRALLVFGLWGAGRESAVQHLAGTLSVSPVPQQRARGQELSWVLRAQIWWWGGWLIFFWTYFELMLPSLLAQPGFNPVSLVLYNFLHYGRINALAAKLLCALLLPLGAMLVLTSLRRWRPHRWRLLREE